MHCLYLAPKCVSTSPRCAACAHGPPWAGKPKCLQIRSRAMEPQVLPPRRPFPHRLIPGFTGKASERAPVCRPNPACLLDETRGRGRQRPSARHQKPHLAANMCKQRRPRAHARGHAAPLQSDTQTLTRRPDRGGGGWWLRPGVTGARLAGLLISAYADCLSDAAASLTTRPPQRYTLTPTERTSRLTPRVRWSFGAIGFDPSPTSHHTCTILDPKLPKDPGQCRLDGQTGTKGLRVSHRTDSRTSFTSSHLGRGNTSDVPQSRIGRCCGLASLDETTENIWDHLFFLVCTVHSAAADCCQTIDQGANPFL